MSQPKILQLNVRLVGSQPLIWRQLEIGEEASLGDLHYAVQACMDWENAHLHQFRVGKRVFGPSDFEEQDDAPEDENELTLGEAFSGRTEKIFYDYDFGDDWQHEITLTDKVPANNDVEYPRCTGGARCAPPEDCGGIAAYTNILETLKDPKHPDYEDIVEWLGDDEFDPEYFSIAEANERLLFGAQNHDVDDEDEENDDEDDVPEIAAEDAVGELIYAVVEAQVDEEEPPAVKAALQKLLKNGMDEDEAWDLIAAAYTLETYRAYAEHRLFDLNAYVKILKGLPKLPR